MHPAALSPILKPKSIKRPAVSSPRSASAPRKDAREKLLAAAAGVFARDGLAGATTREIAREAGVNEVTLFRLFRTKQNLLTAVLERVFATGPGEEMKAAPGDLRAIIREYASGYAANLRRNLALRRVLIGEIQHFQEHELTVIRGIFEPARQQVIARLRQAQKLGVARRDIDPAIIADQINAMVFMGELKHSLPLGREYAARDYVSACVETILRATEVRR
jgi:AcrR family transcriptional regulator